MSKRALPVVPYQSSIHRQGGSSGWSLGSMSRQTMPKPTRENPIIISASELKSFLRCRVQWQWRYQDQLESAIRKPQLALGTVVHEVIDQFYHLPVARRTPKVMEKLARLVIPKMAAEEPLSNEDHELAIAMLVGYAHWAPDENAEIGLGECFPEEEFNEPLTESGLVRIKGKIDLRFKSTTYKKTMGMLETKTAKQFKESIVEQNLQLSVYLWRLRTSFPGMKGYIAYYDQLRKQMPSPRVKSDLFKRDPIERSEDEVRQWAIDAERSAFDMLDAAIYPSPQDTCAWSCDFQNACLLRGEPEDLKHVLTSAFKVKPPYDKRPKRDYKVKV